MSPSELPFDQRACFIAGPAKSGTTLLATLLDGHPELLVFPQETAYFPTLLRKYGTAGRRRQFDYLTKESFARVLFGGEARWGSHDYRDFPQRQFLQTFETLAFAGDNSARDLLAVMMEAYASTIGKELGGVKQWVEKTPANRNETGAIVARFPQAKLLVTIRDPRALLAAQIALERERQRGTFSTYYVVAHWRAAAKLANRIYRGEICGLVVPYEQLVTGPTACMRKVCDYLGIRFDSAAVLSPTKMGQPWHGNSAAGMSFSRVSAEPVARWERELSEAEIGWVEWHCRDLMPAFGYEPRLDHRRVRHWLKPVRGERSKEYLKSRAYSVYRSR
jgi:hypothetical protein